MALDIKGLHLRAALLQIIRKFFCTQGFLEVDTPIRQRVLLPENNILPLKSEGAFLQPSPELCMKRLLAAGCAKIFQICHCFRARERGRLHLEEFLMLEWYRQGADYHQLMDDCQLLLRFIHAELTSLEERNGIFFDCFPGLDLFSSWQKITVEDAFQRYSPVPLAEAIATNCFEEILVETIEPNLGFTRPLFLCDYPLALASLARKKPENSQFAERFELYLKGVELANGFTELTDEQEQRQRFTDELAAIQKSRGEQHEMPELFLTDLAALDSATGIALGVDRLFMLATGIEDIQNAVPFSPEDLQP